MLDIGRLNIQCIRLNDRVVQLEIHLILAFFIGEDASTRYFYWIILKIVSDWNSITNAGLENPSLDRVCYRTEGHWHIYQHHPKCFTWWRHQIETFSALLAFYAGNRFVSSEFATQRSVTRSFDVFFDLRLNKWLSKQCWEWWFRTPSCSLWRHCHEVICSNGTLLLSITYTLANHKIFENGLFSLCFLHLLIWSFW